MKTLARHAITACLVALASSASAQDVRITTFKTESTFTLNGQTFTIQREQDQSATLQGDFARTARACPPDCIQPIRVAEGVMTIGELEVMRYLESTVSDGTGLLLDTRGPQDFATGAIPGAVNVPAATLHEENRFRDDILRALGATSRGDGTLDYSTAMNLAVYSGGVWSGDAAQAIKNLLAAGYPPEKLFYYRGGMQAWVHVGLTVQTSANSG